MNEERIEDKVQNTKQNDDTRRPSKGKRSNASRKKRNNQGGMKEKFKDTKVTSKCNDVTWYAANSELLKSAASLPFSTTSGLPVDIFPETKEGVPGILTIHWTPALFGATYAHDNKPYTPSDAIKGNWANAPVNQAACSMYSYTVHANSRNKSYDAADEMLLVLAGAQVFSMLAFGIRAYGIMRKYDQQNAYTPAHLIRAMGFEYSSLQSNLANMWFTLNDLIDRAQQIWIPNTFPFIERWFWMNSNLYKDASGVKSQYYMFVPATFYQYNETLNDMGGGLEPINWLSSTHTWSDYVNMVTTAIEKLLLSQDRGIIFGDILKAYGADKLYKIGTISSDYMVEPVYDQEVLTQIENSTALPIYPKAISQWDNGALSQEFSEQNPVKFINKSVLNFHTDAVPTPEMIMVATRLTTLGVAGTIKSDGSAYTAIAPGTTGTEYVNGYAVWTLVNGQLLSDWITTTNSFGNETSATAADLQRMSRWCSFDWAPWIYTTKGDLVPGSDMNVIRAYGDYDQYTTLDRATLQKMHRTAVYSEFGMPTEV